MREQYVLDATRAPTSAAAGEKVPGPVTAPAVGLFSVTVDGVPAVTAIASVPGAMLFPLTNVLGTMPAVSAVGLKVSVVFEGLVYAVSVTVATDGIAERSSLGAADTAEVIAGKSRSSGGGEPSLGSVSEMNDCIGGGGSDRY